uniref:Uncharacterized protein n=1 Tax=Triticum urartu TaxID=4572 RepID=A0A8R7UUZ7_TRIUA
MKPMICYRSCASTKKKKMHIIAKKKPSTEKMLPRQARRPRTSR